MIALNKLVGVYGRCSTDKQDLITQKSQLANFIEFYKKNNQIDFLDEYIDDGYSGSNQSRPRLQAMLKDIRSGKLNTIIVVKLDRLARTIEDLLQLTNEFKLHNVDLIVIKDNVDTSTASGKLYFHILSAFIEFERNTIVQRMKDGREYAEAHGSKSGKPCHRPKKDLDIEKIKLFYKQGLSLNNIAKTMGVTHQTIKKRLSEAL